MSSHHSRGLSCRGNPLLKFTGHAFSNKVTTFSDSCFSCRPDSTTSIFWFASVLFLCQFFAGSARFLFLTTISPQDLQIYCRSDKFFWALWNYRACRNICHREYIAHHLYTIRVWINSISNHYSSSRVSWDQIERWAYLISLCSEDHTYQCC